MDPRDEEEIQLDWFTVFDPRRNTRSADPEY
jgi:hypothetical protein